jgi:alkylhydroperoxidase/carboxymuconolactone decarboxylase family protein YurZ
MGASRPRHGEATRRVLAIGTLLALGRWEEFRLQIRAALAEGGLSTEQLKEIVLQQAVYCGIPAANAGFQALREALASPG